MMALVGERRAVTGSKEEKDETDKENLWACILGEVQTRGTNKLPSNKNIIVLGDRESGKTTLIAKLQGIEDPKKGYGLEYAYIDVRDEYRDDHTQLSVWLLDGDPSQAHLLDYALTTETYPHTLVMLSVSFTSPWGIMDQLQAWASLLQDHIDRLPLSSDTVKEYQHKSAKRWHDYIEPGDELDLSASMRRTSKALDDDDAVLPLADGVLSRNLGLDLVVVVTKTDYIATLEKDMDYKDEHLDFIQQHIRKFCLTYGAALFYTSVKEDKNCDLLYKYLVHRIYGFVFRTPALVVEKDAVFIPAGWDNEKKISILYENMHSMKPDDDYTDVIVRPVARKAAPRELEVQADEEQAFLSRQLQLLQQSTPVAAATPPGIAKTDGVGTSPMVSAGSAPSRPSSGVPKVERRTSGPNTSLGSPNSLASPKKIDGNKVGTTGTSEGVLANFFNSLLKKNSTGPAMPLHSADRAAVQAAAASVTGPEGLNRPLDKTMAAAELERLSRARLTPPNSVDSSEC